MSPTLAERVSDGGVVYGSLLYRAQEVRRLVGETISLARSFQPGNLSPEQMDAFSIVKGEKSNLILAPEGFEGLTEHHRRLSGALVLLSAEARNLFDVLPRLRRASQRVVLRDGDANETGSTKLTDLFNHFIHNRYLYLAGENVHNLFPGNVDRSPIAKTFMGYRFNWLEYVEKIDAVARGVTVKDLTGLLRRRLENLTLQTPYGSIVSLVQDLVSFSGLLSGKVGDPRYRGLLDEFFKDHAQSLCDSRTPPGCNQIVHTVHFKAPTVRIEPRLSERRFVVTVKSKWTLRDRQGHVVYADSDFHDLEKHIDYDQLLTLVARTFGDDPLV